MAYPRPTLNRNVTVESPKQRTFNIGNGTPGKSKPWGNDGGSSYEFTVESVESDAKSTPWPNGGVGSPYGGGK